MMTLKGIQEQAEAMLTERDGNKYLPTTKTILN